MSKKILLIDDEPDMLKTVKARLEANHYEVTTALNGDEGLQKLSTSIPDLIILDIMMPKMDGYTFVRKIKANMATSKIPVVILTAKEKMQELFAVEGVNNYLVKPFQDEELLTLLKKLLKE